MNSKNEGIELSVIKGIAGIDFNRISLLYKRKQLASSLNNILFVNYINGTKYKINKINFINIEDCYPYHVASVIHNNYSRTKRRFTNRRRKYEIQ